MFFRRREGVGDGRSLQGPERSDWLLGAISPSTGAALIGSGADGLRSDSEALVERFSLFEGTRRELADVRDFHERAAKDLEPRRTCSVGESAQVGKDVS